MTAGLLLQEELVSACLVISAKRGCNLHVVLLRHNLDFALWVRIVRVSLCSRPTSQVCVSPGKPYFDNHLGGCDLLQNLVGTLGSSSLGALSNGN